jgi:hypothetical protein
MSPEQGGPQGYPQQYPPPGQPGQYPPPGQPGQWGAQTPAYNPPPGYPQQGYYPPGYPQRAPSNGFGTAALILGIVGLITAIFGVGILLGILAVIFGFLGRGRAKRGEASNGGAALAGVITGALAFVGGAVLYTSLFIWGAHHGFNDYRDCLRHADTRTEQQDCANQFQANFDQ